MLLNTDEHGWKKMNTDHGMHGRARWPQRAAVLLSASASLRESPYWARYPPEADTKIAKIAKGDE